MTPQEQREYAATLIFEHAREVEYLSIFEMAEEHTGDTISDQDAGAVADLIVEAEVTVSWPSPVDEVHVFRSHDDGQPAPRDLVAQAATNVRAAVANLDRAWELLGDAPAMRARVYASVHDLLCGCAMPEDSAVHALSHKVTDVVLKATRGEEGS